VKTLAILVQATFASLTTLSLARPAFAADLDLTSLPASCVGVVTVQKRECSVDTYYKCTEEAGREVWIEGFDADGWDGLEVFNAAGEFVASGDDEISISARNEGPVFSIERLLAEGTVIFAQPIEVQIFGARQPSIDSVSAQLLSGMVVIDGLEFQKALLTHSVPLNVVGTIGGSDVLYLNRDLGLVISGESVVEIGKHREESNETPVRFDLPTEPGFMSSVPEYDCDQLSGLGGNAADKRAQLA
jgi:hypothetical protein